MRTLVLSLALLLILVKGDTHAQAQVRARRTLSLDDLFSMQQLGRNYGGPVAISPDGRQIAFVIQRPKSTATHHPLRFLYGNDRADVYIFSVSDGKTVDITDGLADGAGSWAPSWSPDGKRALH